MSDDLTVLIKTIHRPQSCATAIRSFRRHAPWARVLVLDDSRDEYRLTRRAPRAADLCDEVIETDFDVGISAGRNRLVEAARTPFVMIIDDDMFLRPGSRLRPALERLRREPLDVMGLRHGARGGGPLLMSPIVGDVMWIRPGARAWRDGLGHCDMVDNCFLARRRALLEVPWRDELKVHEHWEFFWRAKQVGLRVAALRHPPVGRDPGRGPAHYRWLRRRRAKFLPMGLRAHGFRELRRRR